MTLEESLTSSQFHCHLDAPSFLQRLWKEKTLYHEPIEIFSFALDEIDDNDEYWVEHDGTNQYMGYFFDLVPSQR